MLRAHTRLALVETVPFVCVFFLSIFLVGNVLSTHTAHGIGCCVIF